MLMKWHHMNAIALANTVTLHYATVITLWWGNCYVTLM